MGANLCSFRQPNTTDNHDHQQDNEPKNPSSHIVRMIKPTSSSTPTCSAIMGLIRRPGCCLAQITGGRHKRSALLVMHQQAENKSSKARKLTTLEDWLINSPGTSDNTKPDRFTSGELYVFKHSSRKVHPSSSSSSSSNHYVPSARSSSSSSLASRAMDSITLEMVAKSATGITTTDHKSVGGAKEVELEGANSSSLSRSRSDKLVKKVSFKEEPDIILIYSPEEAAYLE